MAKTNNDWKDRLNIVYSTDPDFNYETPENEETESVAPNKQRLRLRIEKNGRGGKTATIISGFKGPESEQNKLAKTLKTYCGAGGAAKDSEIIIQGDMRDKLIAKLKSLGYGDTK
jgi:translation initiation factor 1